MEINKNYKFINPYNDTPLGDKCNRNIDNSEDKVTGYINCTLTTHTPLIITDKSKVMIDKKVKDHKIYNETFIVNGRPFIPGSELRGMIRNKFETLTNSCMSSLEEELPFYGRYNGNMRNPGILDFSNLNHVKLYKCNKYEITDSTYNDKKTGDKVSFTVIRKTVRGKQKTYAKIDDKGEYIGYIKKGAKFQNRNKYHIFEKIEEVTDIINQDDFKDMYDELCERHNKNKSNKEEHPSITKNNLRPIWYEMSEDGYVYFSLGQNGQTKYRRRLKNLVNPSYLPCKDINNLCEACTLFGTVQDGISKGGKIRVEDALLEEGVIDYYLSQRTLPELASPHYENPYFYMIINDNDINNKDTNYNWNVDFKSKFSMKKNTVFHLNDDDIMIRGRKEYWHHIPINQKVDKTNRNVSVRPLKDGLTYTFKVYFQNITITQLEHLNMSINLGNNSSYMHKLGLGKPLGYGSVKITTAIKLKDVSYDNGKIIYKIQPYIPKYNNIEEIFDLSEKQLQSLKQIYDFNFISNHDIKVDYPRNSENGRIFEWFEANKKQNIVDKTLPFGDRDYDDIIQYGFINNNKKNGKGKKK